MGIRLIEVELRVRDLERSLRFYRDLLGLSVEADEHDGERHAHAVWGSWKADESFLMLNLYPTRGEETRSRIGLAVDDLGAAHERLTHAGVVVREPPSRRPWGTSGSYLDPDGNIVALIERPGR